MASQEDVLTVQPLGYMHTVFQYKNGTPRQPSLCSTARGSLTIEKSVFNNPEHSLEGLEQYSHAWIIFVFHKNNKQVHTKAKVKPPRLNGQKVGVFSTRSPYRPNPTGLTLAKIERITGSTVHFSGIDIVDGTPVLDIKPFIPQYDCPKCGHHNTVDSRTDSAASVNPLSPILPSTQFRGGRYEAKKVNTDESTKTSAEKEDSTENYDASLVCGHQALDTRETRTVPVSVPQTEVASPALHSEYESSSDLASCEEVTNASLLVDTAVSSLGSTSEKSESRPLDALVCSEHTDDRDDLVQPTAISDNVTEGEVTPQPSVKMEKNGNFSNTFDVSVKPVVVNATIDLTELPNKSKYQSDLRKISSADTTAVAQWLSAPPVSKLKVTFTPTAEEQLKLFADLNSPHSDTHVPSLYRLDFLRGENEIRTAITSVLSEDPRSVYRRKKCADMLYFFTVDKVHVTCWFDEDRAEVLRLQPVCVVEKLSQKS